VYENAQTNKNTNKSHKKMVVVGCVQGFAATDAYDGECSVALVRPPTCDDTRLPAKKSRVAATARGTVNTTV
jgi:hypothetical protein